MPEIDFEPVARYLCPGCKRRTYYRPCPVCLARQAASERGKSAADALLLATGRKVEREIHQARH